MKKFEEPQSFFAKNLETDENDPYMKMTYCMKKPEVDLDLANTVKEFSNSL